MISFNVYQPFFFPRKQIQISHVLFADYWILFGVESLTQWTHTKLLLTYLQNWTGLHRNPNKSQIFFSKNTPIIIQNDIIEASAFMIMPTTAKYLGNPILCTKGKAVDFQFIIQKFHHKLSGWKCNLLTQAGLTVLIKHCLATIPIYFMSIRLLPCATINSLEQIIRSFWWKGGTDATRGLHLISWDKICKPKYRGGLGFKNLKSLNEAILMKSFWELLHTTNQTHNSWHTIIHNIYLNSHSIWEVVPSSNNSWHWKCILKIR